MKNKNMKPKDVIFEIKGAIKEHYKTKSVKEGVKALTLDILSNRRKDSGKSVILDIISRDSQVSIKELEALNKT